MQRRRALPRERREQGDGGGEAEEMDGLGLWREGERESSEERRWMATGPGVDLDLGGP
jgi:hypothetical protein